MTGILKIAAWAAFLLNIVAMGTWVLLNPPATYERLADRDIRLAHAAYRKVNPEESYALYRKVVESYPRSTFASEARFFAARTAFLGLGQFAEAERDLDLYLKGSPDNEEHAAEARDFLELIRGRADLREEVRDAVLWEYVQAVNEESNGQYRRAQARLERITEQYGSTGIGKRASSILPRVSGKANEA